MIYLALHIGYMKFSFVCDVFKCGPVLIVLLVGVWLAINILAYVTLFVGRSIGLYYPAGERNIVIITFCKVLLCLFYKNQLWE